MNVWVMLGSKSEYIPFSLRSILTRVGQVPQNCEAGERHEPE